MKGLHQIKIKIKNIYKSKLYSNNRYNIYITENCLLLDHLHNDWPLTTDVNECFLAQDNCDQICMNTNGSYGCQCHAGHTLNADNRTCLIG